MEENQRTYNPEENQGLQEVTFDMGGLKLAFWGLIFTVINIRIQGFDIVPDVVGYIMVIVGLGRIEKYEKNFTMAKWAAIILAVLALNNIYQAPVQHKVNQMGMEQTVASSMNFNAGMFGAVLWLAVILIIVGLAVNIYFIYSMCMGIKNLSNQVGDYKLAEICDDRWKLILGSEVGLLISALLVLLEIMFGVFMVMLFGVLTLVALVMFLLLINHAHKSIHGNRKVEL